MLQTLVFPILNLAACVFSLTMIAWHWRRLGYLPKECALALPALVAFGIGYIFVIAGVVHNLGALRGVLVFLFLVPGTAVYLRAKELHNKELQTG